MPNFGSYRGTFRCAVLLTVAWAALCNVANAQAIQFDIPSQPLSQALRAYAHASNEQIIFSDDLVRGRQSPALHGNYTAPDALEQLLKGTDLSVEHVTANEVVVSRARKSSELEPVQLGQVQLAQASPVKSIETVTVTSSKLGGGDVQSIPIAITALSQEQLTATQTAGGPDLVKQVPNLTFSKTNFTGYNIQIRGIGTQAISVTTDPAVAVALNDIPFIRNHFFEQEFYDLASAEVLRGPQGTLYGRNATAGVVNLITAKPTDQFEAMASGEIGSYQQRRFEGMVNLPIVDDRVDLRVAGEWTKRQGYSFDSITDQRIDGRDLWSGRVSLSINPTENWKNTLVWEHFSEDDDRMRTSKQLCKTSLPPASVNGVSVPSATFNIVQAYQLTGSQLSQGCEATSLYSRDAFEVPDGFTLPYMLALAITGDLNGNIDPYASTTQSTNLRVIESAIRPQYRAKNDTLELNSEYAVTPLLTITSQTGYNNDFLYSAEDFNRFNTTPGVFIFFDGHPPGQGGRYPDPSGLAFCGTAGCNLSGGQSLPPGAPCAFTLGNGEDCQQSAVFCDPQVGCSDRIVAEDLSDERAWQLSQEFRLQSHFQGPFNFSVGGNYLHYETEENYYVFINALTAYSRIPFGGDAGGSGSTSDNSDCLNAGKFLGGWQNLNPGLGGGEPAQSCLYIDPNPITRLNNEGHNYFLSQNPYTLNSYAAFGEANFDLTSELKLTGGLRWTEDQKHFVDIPSEVITQGYGYPVTGIVNQQWDEITGRAVLNWTPKLDFTDQTLVYGSYAHGYKAGGANPPGAEFDEFAVNDVPFPIHPLTFKPEFIDAFEIGSKNTALDGALTLNGDIFYYDYKNYQISEIVDRTSINLNFNATVKGAELEAAYEPVPGLQFNFSGGYEDTRISNGQSAIDLMDRTDAASHPGWLVVKPFPTEASNCILPDYVVAALIQEHRTVATTGSMSACQMAYTGRIDPVTLYPYMPNPVGVGGIGYGGCVSGDTCTFQIPAGYSGFDPTQPDINNGEGFAKPLGGKTLPNAPPFTVSFGAQYTLPITTDWAGTLRGDYYWQDYSWARVFNDEPYDRIRGYTNVNLTLIFTSQNGWQVMLYDKNVFNETAITGAFLNSDDTGLTTNVFLTDPRLIGVRVTKNW